MSGTTRRYVLLELIQVSKSLQDVILTFTSRNNKMDDLIKIMSTKVTKASTSHASGHDAGTMREIMRTMRPMRLSLKLVGIKKSVNFFLSVIQKNNYF